MKKYVIAAVIFLIFSLTLMIVSQSHLQKDLAEIIDNKPEKIERIKLNIPANHDYKSTTDQDKIDQLIDHLNTVKYESTVGNESTYFPSRASIIYLYNQDGDSDFIVPYGREVMIDHTIYATKDGQLSKDWLVQFYHSLK